MYATIADIAQIPDGAYRLEQVGTGEKAVLAFWDTEKEARDAAGEYYVVHEAWTGPSVNDRPVTCAFVHLDGPMTQERWDAGEYAHKKRIRPLLETFEGYVRGYTLVDWEKRSVVAVGFANSFDKADEIGTAVNSMELLPDEDPALLQGHDRFALYQVG
jgi:hypothetical protein